MTRGGIKEEDEGEEEDEADEEEDEDEDQSEEGQIYDIRNEIVETL